MKPDTVNKIVILLMTIGISALFLSMIAPFLMALFLAGVFSALARPLFLRLESTFGGRRNLASLVTLLTVAICILIPLAVLVGVVLSQAVDVSQSVGPWVKKTLAEPAVFSEQLHRLPFYDELAPYRDEILSHAAKAVSMVSRLLVDGLSSFTLGTVNFLFMSFVLLYSMYFLQMDGHKLIERILYYLPLETRDERMMLDKFTSVTRATLKGSLLIGLLQGVLAGIAFAVVGVDNAVFWGTVMAVLSVIPGVGSALIWGPASVILMVQGHMATGAGLALFCGLVVGSLDNVLRPILVGKDTKMHELMIFFGTMGGILMFGITGVFIGPLIASLFITIWEMYGIQLAEYLPDLDSIKLRGGDDTAIKAYDQAEDPAEKDRDAQKNRDRAFGVKE